MKMGDICFAAVVWVPWVLLGAYALWSADFVTIVCAAVFFIFTVCMWSRHEFETRVRSVRVAWLGPLFAVMAGATFGLSTPASSLTLYIRFGFQGLCFALMAAWMCTTGFLLVFASLACLQPSQAATYRQMANQFPTRHWRVAAGGALLIFGAFAWLLWGAVQVSMKRG
jgi:hypothetical protein